MTSGVTWGACEQHNTERSDVIHYAVHVSLFHSADGTLSSHATCTEISLLANLRRPQTAKVNNTAIFKQARLYASKESCGGFNYHEKNKQLFLHLFRATIPTCCVVPEGV